VARHYRALTFDTYTLDAGAVELDITIADRGPGNPPTLSSARSGPEGGKEMARWVGSLEILVAGA
jgi:hypothetical protein